MLSKMQTSQFARSKSRPWRSAWKTTANELGFGDESPKPTFSQSLGMTYPSRTNGAPFAVIHIQPSQSDPFSLSSTDEVASSIEKVNQWINSPFRRQSMGMLWEILKERANRPEVKALVEISLPG